MTVCFCHPVLNRHKVDRMAYFEVLAHGLSLYAKIASLRHDLGFLDLNYTLATRETVARALRTHANIDTFIFAGHAEGGKRLTGHGMEPCLDACNADCLDGKKVYLISCNTARALGIKALDAGAEFCIAFEGKVYLMSSQQEVVISSCLIDELSIARQSKARGIFESILRRHKTWIDRIGSVNEPNNGWLLALSVLDWNMEHLMLVTKDGLEKGVTVLPKIYDTSKNVSEKDIKKAIDYVRQLKEREVGTMPEIVTGDGEDLSSENIVRKLEERLRSGDWGKDDFAERYLACVLRCMHII